MSTSTFVVRAPEVSTHGRNYSTAERFLSAVKACYRGRVQSLPVRGASKSAKYRKVDPLDCLSMDVHEAVSVLRELPDVDAVECLQALTEDASKAESICVKLARVERPASLLEAEVNLSVSFGAVVCAIDEIRRNHSTDQRQLHNLIMGAEARLQSARLCAGMGE